MGPRPRAQAHGTRGCVHPQQLSWQPAGQSPTADGILATLTARAGAGALRDELRRIGFQLQARLHTGGLELCDRDAVGIAVHMAAMVMAAAGPEEILASRTVRNLVVGSDLAMKDRGTRQLKESRAAGSSLQSRGLGLLDRQVQLAGQPAPGPPERVIGGLNGDPTRRLALEAPFLRAPAAC